MIEIFDVLNLRFQGTPSDVDYSPSESILAAEWKIIAARGQTIKRYSES